jgi:DNA-directed RNA polymerase subunit omega
MPAQPRNTLMNPPIEDLLDKVDSKFTLVALSSKRARQINSYYNQLGEGMGVVVPPQVTSVSGKPLTIAFEEVAAGKATYHRPEPGEEDEIDALAEISAADALLAPVEVPGIDILAVDDIDDLGLAETVTDDVDPVDIAADEITPPPTDLDEILEDESSTEDADPSAE